MMGECSGEIRNPEPRRREAEEVYTELEHEADDYLYDTGIEGDESNGPGVEKRWGVRDRSAGCDGFRSENVLRMEFSTHVQARDFYNEYSRVKGFAIRHGKTVKNANGEVVRYSFVCNREGFRMRKWLEKVDRKRQHKPLTRCGCLAEMRIKRHNENGKWFVSKFVDDHNHTLVPGKYVCYLPSHRMMSDVEIAQMNSLLEVGISIPKIYHSFAMQVGGYNMVRFTKQDMHNEIRKQRALQSGDVNAALLHFKRASRDDEKMFWRYEVGIGDRMSDLIWSDGRSQEDYLVFGDVLAFDATYGRNKYNLLVIVLSGVNHHNQTCVFATAMVSCESQTSYKWVLENFLKCMQGKAPKAVITDGDPSMRVAINQVFPEAHHRLCAWHLLQNATANISQPQFTHLFKQCMLGDFEVNEFEMHWDAMLEECGVRDMEWVKDVYKKKHSWATAYIRGRFFAAIRTTSRCESLHVKLGRFVENRYGILDFVTHFRRCVDFLRDREDELDFRSCYGAPVMQTQFLELEKSASMHFTREIYHRFRECLKRSSRFNTVERVVVDDGAVYVVQKYSRPDMTWRVAHIVRNNNFACSYLRMESFGVPCAHILLVLRTLHIIDLPQSLLLRRWCKNVKSEVMMDRVLPLFGDPATLYRSRLGAFVHQCKRLGKVACLRDEDFNETLDKVMRDTRLLEVKNRLHAEEGTSHAGDEATNLVNDPVRVRTKGTGKGNTNGNAKGPKRRKCSACGKLGHWHTRCPYTKKGCMADAADALISDLTGSPKGGVGTFNYGERDGTVAPSSCTTFEHGSQNKKMRVDLPNNFSRFI